MAHGLRLDPSPSYWVPRRLDNDHLGSRTMSEHYLETITRNNFGSGWTGECVCHDPDGNGDGRMDFHGATAQEVVDNFNEHLLRRTQK